MNFGRRCHWLHLYLSIGASIHSLVHMVYWYARCVKCFGNVYMVLVQEFKLLEKTVTLTFFWVQESISGTSVKTQISRPWRDISFKLSSPTSQAGKGSLCVMQKIWLNVQGSNTAYSSWIWTHLLVLKQIGLEPQINHVQLESDLRVQWNVQCCVEAYVDIRGPLTEVHSHTHNRPFF